MYVCCWRWSQKQIHQHPSQRFERLASAPTWNDVAPVVEFRSFEARCPRTVRATDQREARADRASSPLFSAPASLPSDCQCSGFVSETASATLRLPGQFFCVLHQPVEPHAKRSDSRAQIGPKVLS